MEGGWSSDVMMAGSHPTAGGWGGAKRADELGSTGRVRILSSSPPDSHHLTYRLLAPNHTLRNLPAMTIRPDDDARNDAPLKGESAFAPHPSDVSSPRLAAREPVVAPTQPQR